MRGLRVEVEVLDDERTSTPAVFKDLGRCLTLPAAVCRLIVLIGVICSSVWRALSVARTSDALVLDVESCNQLAGCPGCGLNRSRPRARGGGGDRRALGRGPKTSGRSWETSTLRLTRTRPKNATEIPMTGVNRAGVQPRGALRNGVRTLSDSTTSNAG